MKKETNSMKKERVYATLRSMGVTANYKGYHYLADAVTIAMELLKGEKVVLRITKDVYPEIAAKYKVKPGNIELDIRTAIEICWKRNEEKVKKIVGDCVKTRPTNSEFIEGIAYFFEENKEN